MKSKVKYILTDYLHYFRRLMELKTMNENKKHELEQGNEHLILTRDRLEKTNNDLNNLLDSAEQDTTEVNIKIKEYEKEIK